MLIETFKLQDIQQAEARLNQYGLTLDNLNGVVSTIKTKPVPSIHGVLVNLQTPVNRFKVFHSMDKPKDISFTYKTAKSNRNAFPNTAPSTHSNDEWFDLFYDVSVLLATKIGATRIIVESGRKDKALLESRDFTKTLGPYFDYSKDL